MNEHDDSPAPELLDPEDHSQLLAAVPVPNAGLLTEEQRERVRRTVTAYLDKHRITKRAFAQGLGYGTDALWVRVLNGAYDRVGTVDDHLREANHWIEQDARRQQEAVHPE